MDERNDYASECPNFDDVRAVVSRALVWAIIVVFASVVVASWCLGAPAPKPRPKPAPKAVTVERLAPHHLVGTWTMSWRGTDYATTLDAGGGYRAVGPGGTEWLGAWALDGEGGLKVTEAVHYGNGNMGAAWTWGVQWRRDGRNRIDPADLSGAIDGDGEFRLVRVKK